MTSLLLLLLLRLAPECPVDGRVTSEYGRRRDPITSRWKHHRGIDISAPAGTPLRAMWPGTVTKVRRSRRGYGNRIVVRSGEFGVLYAHAGVILVDPGETVVRGQIVGEVGNTGRTTGSHLHLEVWRGRKAIDPRVLLWGCYERRRP